MGVFQSLSRRKQVRVIVVIDLAFAATGLLRVISVLLLGDLVVRQGLASSNLDALVETGRQAIVGDVGLAAAEFFSNTRVLVDVRESLLRITVG